MEDMDKLLRVLHWIKERPDGGICIHAGDSDDMTLYVWADASDNCHFDAKGHTGVYISIGKDNGSPVFFMSKVQSLVSRSSTEAELIAVYQSIPLALWAMQALSEWGYVQEQQDLISRQHLDHYLLAGRFETLLENRPYQPTHLQQPRIHSIWHHCDASLFNA